MRVVVMISGGAGGYAATAPGLPGCSAVGRTRGEALASLREVVRRHGARRDAAGLFLHRILARHGVRSLRRSEMVDVSLSSASRIVRRNGGVVRCVRYDGLAGLFRKDDPMPWRFGRALCDRVRREFASDGFLTSDELPRYGMGTEELAAIRAAAGAGPSDLVVVYAYGRETAERIDDHLFATLRRLAAPVRPA